MKTQREIYQALLDGHTLISTTSGNITVKLDNEGFVIGKEGVGIWKRINYYFNYCEDWEIQPETIIIPSVEIPKPIDYVLDMGDEFYFVDFYENYGYDYAVWKGSETDYNLLNNGVIHLSEENAKAHADALLSIMRGKNEN